MQDNLFVWLTVFSLSGEISPQIEKQMFPATVFPEYFGPLSENILCQEESKQSSSCEYLEYLKYAISGNQLSDLITHSF